MYKRSIVLLTFLISFYSICSKAQWEIRKNGLPESWTLVSCLDAPDAENAVVALYNFPKSSLFITNDSGLNWKKLEPLDNIINLEVMDISMIDTNHIWICTAETTPYSARIFATADGGKNWVKQFEDPSKTTFFNYIEMFDLNNGIAMGDAPLNSSEPALFIKTTDGGSNWLPMHNDDLIGAWSGDLWRRLDFVNSSVGYFFESGISPQKLFKTTDSGLNWIETNFNDYAAALKFFNKDYGFAINRNGDVFRTEDGGLNWHTFSSAETGWPMDIEFIPSDPAKVWAVMTDKLAFSSDSGRTWTGLQMKTNFNGIDIKFVDNKHGWLLAQNDVYYTDKGDDIITSNNLLGDAPKEFRLFQNYPNPFNPSTTIKYSIPSEEAYRNTSVQLIIYNLLGEQLTTLVNAEQPGGIYEIEFSGELRDTYIPSGVYFFILYAGKYAETKKMVLMR